MNKKVIRFAFDRSLRTIDQDGRMHVEISNISKAIVNPYRGSEIPQSEALGLNPDMVYWLLRDPAELAKGASTFNNIPILDRHIPVHVDAPQKEFVVGSTGTDAEFDGTFLRNSLVVWDAVAIAGINLKEQCELSSAYRYDAEMTPGVFDGVKYDGIMRNIRGNHVALVEVGRAGPDVVVGDSKLLEHPKMSKKLSANARAVKAALVGFFTQRLAMDAQIGDLTAIAGSVKSLKTAKSQTAFVAKVTAAATPMLAEDADLTGLPELVKQLAQDEEPEDKAKAIVGDEDDEDDEETKAAKKLAKDEEEAAKKKSDDDNPAMDAAMVDAKIKAAVAKNTTDVISRMQAMHAAEKEVEPFVGAIDSASLSSAADIYKLALDQAGVDLDGVHPSAFRSMVKMLAKPGDTSTAATKATGAEARIAQDSATVTDFYKRFPKAKGGV